MNKFYDGRKEKRIVYDDVAAVMYFLVSAYEMMYLISLSKGRNILQLQDAKGSGFSLPQGSESCEI